MTTLQELIEQRNTLSLNLWQHTHAVGKYVAKQDIVWHVLMSLNAEIAELEREALPSLREMKLEWARLLMLVENASPDEQQAHYLEGYWEEIHQLDEAISLATHPSGEYEYDDIVIKVEYDGGEDWHGHAYYISVEDADMSHYITVDPDNGYVMSEAVLVNGNHYSITKYGALVSEDSNYAYPINHWGDKHIYDHFIARGTRELRDALNEEMPEVDDIPF
jgi:hypothetical protein